MPAYVVTLLIGLIAGSAIGYLLSALKSKDSAGNQALLDDYKAQLDAERRKTETAITLNAELMAVKESVAKLSTQSNEANRIRTEAEAKLNTTILEMRRASESIFDETKKIAGALSNSQTRGKFGEAQLVQGYAKAMSTPRNVLQQTLIHREFQISPFPCQVDHCCLSIPSFPLNVFWKPLELRIRRNVMSIFSCTLRI
jgi:uncharacterized membrane-anchored protein YhcB (DUF1043 family)